MPQPSAVVTGAASGIGLALTEELVRSGYRVAMADIRPDLLSAASAGLREKLPDAELLTVASDVTDAASVDALAQEVVSAWGAPDLVINNAGVIGPVGPTWGGDLAQWKLAVDVNLWGVIHSMRSFLPPMIERDAGRVVTIASVASWSSAPMMSSYGATKHAAFALVESAYRELKAQGSNVAMSVVCPTTVRTRLIEDIAEGRQSADDAARERLLAARDKGLSPTEVAQLIVRGIEEGKYLITTDEAWVLNAAQQRLDIARGAEPPLDREPKRS